MLAPTLLLSKKQSEWFFRCILPTSQLNKLVIKKNHSGDSAPGNLSSIDYIFRMWPQEYLLSQVYNKDCINIIYNQVFLALFFFGSLILWKYLYCVQFLFQFVFFLFSFASFFQGWRDGIGGIYNKGNLCVSCEKNTIKPPCYYMIKDIILFVELLLLYVVKIVWTDKLCYDE